MEPAISVKGSPANASRLRSVECFLFAFTACFGGCGAPGEPLPPSPPIPTAVADLTAHQQGNSAQLVFTLPGRTTVGDRLAEPPVTEIFRGTLKPDNKPDNKSFQLVYTIPGRLAENYLTQGKIQFADPIAAEDLRAHPGMAVAYRVRTRAAKTKESADSNTVVLQVYPVAEKISAVEAKVTQDAIALSWPTPIPPATSENVTEYRIYRGEVEGEAPPASHDLSQTKWKSPLTLLASAQSNSYSDSLFEFDKRYVYVVRSVTTVEGNQIESDDSTPAMVAPRDIFPPAAPQNVVAVVLPGTDGERIVDLSWAINLEKDLASYRVYRSEKQGERGELVRQELLLSPAYRDNSVQAGHTYWYTITAVDRAGNESQPSEQALADLSRPLP